MRPLSKKYIKEWQFFINPRTQKVQYNKKCDACVHDCKQSYRAKIAKCTAYEKQIQETKK